MLEGLFPGATATLQRARVAPDGVRLVEESRLRRDAGRDSPGATGLPLAGLAAGSVFQLSDPGDVAGHADTPSGRRPAIFGGGIVLHRAGDRLWVLAIHAPAITRDTYDSGILALLHRLGGELRRSLLASIEIGARRQPDRTDVETAWDLLPLGVALLTSEMRPVLANVAAEDVFSTRSLFAPLATKGRLRPVSREADERLEHAAIRIFKGESLSETLTIESPGARHHLTINLFDVARSGDAAFFGFPQSRPSDHIVATFSCVARMDMPPVAGPAPIREGNYRFG